jgi:hypothetical protein
MERLQTLYLRYGGTKSVRVVLLVALALIALASTTPVGAARIVPNPECNGGCFI